MIDDRPVSGEVCIMTIHLSLEDTLRWEEGGWLSLEIQESIIEHIELLGLKEAVAVVLATGKLAFAVSPDLEVTL